MHCTACGRQLQAEDGFCSDLWYGRRPNRREASYCAIPLSAAQRRNVLDRHCLFRARSSVGGISVLLAMPAFVLGIMGVAMQKQRRLFAVLGTLLSVLALAINDLIFLLWLASSTS